MGCGVDAVAQTPGDAGPSGDTLEMVVVTGTRFGGRIVSDSPTPIDVVSDADLAKSGEVTLHGALKTIVPSFSISQPSTAGALDYTSTPTLRGLSPGELLVLVNGKRRHSTGHLNTNNQIGRGDVSYDFNTIPPGAIGRIEVLRDGASAQYGADAIAGVINVVLDKSLGASTSASTAIYTEGDGFVYDVSGSYGFALPKDGVLRLTARYQDKDNTNRAGSDTRQQYFGTVGGAVRAPSDFYGSGVGLTPAGGNATLDPREATFDRNQFHLGDPEFEAPSVFMNMDLPLTDTLSTYAFGGYSKLEGHGPNFWRRPAQNETVRALHPDGFRPDALIDFENFSFAGGLKGEDLFGFAWDLSSAYGSSRVDSTFIDSNNPSFGANSPVTAYYGGSQFAQWTSNFDVSREIPLGNADPLKVAFGAEYRKEYYELNSGEPNSYLNGGVPILDGPNAGGLAPIGMQPSPGLQPQDASNNQRDSQAVYTELEKEFFGKWLLSGAVRYEDFSDFGDNTTYKLATRFEITEPFALRASYSTGFRAPHLAQSYYSATTTSFASGAPVTLRLFPVDNPVARVLGSSDLKPEESTSISAGFVYTGDALTVSLDAYRIELDDRIALSTTFQDARITTLLTSLGYPGIQSVSYMTNAIDTTTEGVDLTARYRFDLGGAGSLTATLAGNYNETELDFIAPTPAPLAALGITTPLFDLTQQVRMTRAAPKDKASLSLNWERNDLSVNLTNTRYGEVASVAFTSLTPARIAVVTQGYDVELAPTDPAGANSQVIQVFGDEIITDLSISYAFKNLDVTIGSNNLFDTYPDKNIQSTPASVAVGTNGSDNAGTIPYNYISPFGFNGRLVYAKASYKF
jgi:iron complex outermembrane receptor protein